jgi:hypothetical protein
MMKIYNVDIYIYTVVKSARFAPIPDIVAQRKGQKVTEGKWSSYMHNKKSGLKNIRASLGVSSPQFQRS